MVDGAKLLVIFGAGASYDSVPEAFWTANADRQFRPPLTNELFLGRSYFVQQLKGYNPWAGEIIPELRGATAQGRNIEEELERYVNSSATHDRTKCQLMALRLYIKDIVQACTSNWMTYSSNATNYGGLMNRIDRWRAQAGNDVEIVTFNYDVMLESALGPLAGRPLMGGVDNVIKGDRFRVYKLHGSVSWLRLVTGWWPDPGINLKPRQLIERAPEISPTNEIVMEQDRNGRIGVPAIAIPTVAKSGAECPRYHEEALEKALPDVNRILVVGWKGQEQQFVGMLRDHLAGDVRGLVVDRDASAASEVAGALTVAVGKGRFEGADVEGFSALLGDRDVLRGLLES